MTHIVINRVTDKTGIEIARIPDHVIPAMTADEFKKILKLFEAFGIKPTTIILDGPGKDVKRGIFFRIT